MPSTVTGKISGIAQTAALASADLGRPPKVVRARVKDRPAQMPGSKSRLKASLVKLKGFYSLGLIMAKLLETRATVIAMDSLVMNRVHKLRYILALFSKNGFAYFNTMFGRLTGLLRLVAA